MFRNHDLNWRRPFHRCPILDRKSGPIGLTGRQSESFGKRLCAQSYASRPNRSLPYSSKGDLTRLSDDVYGVPAKARPNPINTTSIPAAGSVRCIALYTVRPFPEDAPAYDVHAPSPCDRLGFHRWGPRMTICGQGRKAGNQGSSIASNPLNGRMDAAVLDAAVDLVERGGLYST